MKDNATGILLIIVGIIALLVSISGCSGGLGGVEGATDAWGWGALAGFVLIIVGYEQIHEG